MGLDILKKSYPKATSGVNLEKAETDNSAFLWPVLNVRFSETILALSLVKPVPGIFRENIRYLLVVATAVEVILLGVCFTNNSTTDELNIIPEPLFTVSTEGIQFQNIVGTESGRIFLAGKDGCLHEVVYSLDQGWFGRRCRRINLSRIGSKIY